VSKSKSAREKILHKVKKLFDLSKSSNSEEEMASALEQARRLLQKYGLTMEEVNQSEVESTLGVGDGWTVTVPKSEKVIWINHFAAIVGEYFECKIARDKDIFVFFGPLVLAKSASYGFESIYNQIMDLSDEYSPTRAEFSIRSSIGKHNIGSYSAYCKQAKYEYRTGLALGLENHLNYLKQEEFKRVNNSKINAIVAMTWDIADKWAKENNVILGPDDKKEQKHKVTGTQHCAVGMGDSKLLSVAKGLKEKMSKHITIELTYKDNETLPVLGLNQAILGGRVTALKIGPQEQLSLPTVEEKTEENSSLITFANDVGAVTKEITLGDFAKILNNHDLEIGRNRLYAWLRDKGYLLYDNKPYQRYVDCDWLVLIEKVRKTDNGPVPWCQTRITGKGQINIAKKLRESGKFNKQGKKDA